jgi:uncharacterized protein YidB (DUF937 family)
MSRHVALSTLAVIAVLGSASPILAQQRSAVSGTDLDAAVATSTAPRGEAVRQFLSSEQVQKVAGQMGVSASELSTRVAAMDEATLARIAQRAGLDDQDLAGGANTIVLSTTAVIIILLIVIIVLVD